MYKVFVVDDEIVVREGIRDNINWKENGFIFSGEAPDGEIAYMQIKEIKPDILITDVKMPFVDGLQLSKMVKKNMPWIKIIILSGHNEFSYAKEAISIGVTEYLLKPISSDDLIKSLNNVARQMANEKKEREDIVSLKNKFENNMPVIKGKILNDFIKGVIPISDIKQKCFELDINIASTYYMVAVVELTFKNYNIDGDEKNINILKIDHIIANIIGHNSDIIFFKRDDMEMIIIFKGEFIDHIEESAYSYMQSIKYEIDRNAKDSITIAIGSIQKKIEGIIRSYKDAQTTLKYKYAIGNNKIISYRDIKSIEVKNTKDELEIIRKINVIDFFKFGTSSNINDFLENYIQILNMHNKNYLIYCYHFLIDIILKAINFIDELDGEYSKIIVEIEKMEELIIEVDSIAKFEEVTRCILNKVFEFRDKKIRNKYGDIIDMAKSYINKEHQNQNISLNIVSSHVNVSPSHFSTIFSQETGETFIEYLTKVRVNKAMELLRTTSQRSSEIAYNVGYNDPRYFTYLFKKFTKMTPIEFRNMGKQER